MNDVSALENGTGNDEFEGPEAQVYMIPDKTANGWTLITQQEIETAHEEAIELEEWYTAKIEWFRAEWQNRLEELDEDPYDQFDKEVARELMDEGFLKPPMFILPEKLGTYDVRQVGGSLTHSEVMAAVRERSARLTNVPFELPQSHSLTVGAFNDDSGNSLFYAGTDNSVFGAEGTYKTWLACWQSAQVVLHRQHVVWWNFEPPSPTPPRERIIGMGVPEALVDTYFHFIDKPAYMPHFSMAVDLVVIDALDPAIGFVGKNSTTDAVGPDRVADTYVAPLRARNPALTSLILDHPNKSDETKEGGHTRKQKFTQAAKYRTAMVKRSHKGTAGYAKIILVKDNGGDIQHLPNDVVAFISVDSSGGELTTVHVTTHEPGREERATPIGKKRPESNRQIALDVLRGKALTDEEWQEAVVERLREKYPKHTQTQLGKNARQARYELRNEQGTVESDDSGMWFLVTE
ncbi:hypothetical protein ABZ667_16150 [Streptomyces lavendulae]|uniref:hypothetical protein n=1 Tax=Streptomyces lavendulae TaxID=1914 RepID=UPI00340F8402